MQTHAIIQNMKDSIEIENGMDDTLFDSSGKLGIIWCELMGPIHDFTTESVYRNVSGELNG